MSLLKLINRLLKKYPKYHKPGAGPIKVKIDTDHINNCEPYVPKYNIGNVLCEDPFGIGMRYTIVDIKEGWYSMEFGYQGDHTRSSSVRCPQAIETYKFEERGLFKLE